MPFYGAAILCTDDAGVRSICDDLAPDRHLRLGADATVRAVDVQAAEGRMRFACSARTACRCPRCT